MKTRIGIRREDKNPWERRVPIIPTHVGELIQKNPLELWLQPSAIRIFSDEDYIREGAKIKEDLSSCSLIFAVKEIPVEFFQPEVTYIFFSHTIKGQPYNMPMLKRLMELRCNLIDYERIVNEKGQRLLFFGTQAGQAGMIDSLWALGQRIHYEGISNPFFELKLAHQYSSLVEAKEHTQKIGWQIHNQGLDPILVPLICGFAGYGHVSLGAQQIFDLLPFEEISPEKLHDFYQKGNFASNKIYKVIFKEEHMVKPVASSQSFGLQDYYQHPEKYQAILSTYLPYLTVLMNCIYWAPQYPHFVTKQFLREHWKAQKSPRLKIIGDISCDVEGAIECTVHPTNPGNPVYVFDPIEEKAGNGIEGRGVVVMATDNLPAELPLESSIYFSDCLMPFVPKLAGVDFSKSFDDCTLPDPIKKAVILYQGDLTPDYEYMKQFL
jgi:saccharopine dehydrogenase (NAD+, L-lysine-forming)